MVVSLFEPIGTTRLPRQLAPPDETFRDLWGLLRACFGAVYLCQQRIEFFSAMIFCSAIGGIGTVSVDNF